MRPGQDLFYLTQSILQKTKELFIRIKPALVIVQGDTTSSMAAALAAFYLQIPVAHVEAGLRTDSISEPFPEEMNRRFISLLARYHFAPTPLCAAHLLAQGVAQDAVFCTGNTVVDALRSVQEKIQRGQLEPTLWLRSQLDAAQLQGKKVIVLTAHRRESFAHGIEHILRTIKEFLTRHPEVVCIYPTHPNPHVVDAISMLNLSALTNMVIVEPLSYKDMVHLLFNADGVITDSGGIQEEAISLGKRVLILRDKTERVEGIWAGLAQLVGTDPEKIFNGLEKFIMAAQTVAPQSVYGDGHAAEKIVTLLRNERFAQQENSYVASVAMPSVVPQKKEDCMKKVTVLGLGYIGLPSAIVIADSGWQVSGFDIDHERVAKINQGDPVIQEPEIFEKLQIALASARLQADAAVQPADYFIIAVPTPFKEEKKADLSCVFDAAASIVPLLRAGNTVIVESTIPVGTTRALADFFTAKTGMVVGKDFFVAHCPERVLPGKIFHELVENTRIIGGVTQACVQQAKLLYQQFVRGTLYLTNDSTAEMVKLIENSSRDAQIAFANQVASMAYATGLNPYEVIELANKHPRVNILTPSCGVGGHCIAVDPWFLVESFPQQTQFIKAARVVNDQKPFQVIDFINKAVSEWESMHAKPVTVALLGLTYKADVDDLRESPALLIAQELTAQKRSTVLVCEPYITKNKLSAQFGDHAPEVYAGVTAYCAGTRSYDQIPAASVDCAVMEKSDRISVLPVDFVWYDVGNVEVFLTLQEQFSDARNTVIAIDAHNNLVDAGGIPVALVGVDDLCVVRTDQALLITKRGDSEKVKLALQEFKRIADLEVF